MPFDPQALFNNKKEFNKDNLEYVDIIYDDRKNNIRGVGRLQQIGQQLTLTIQTDHNNNERLTDTSLKLSQFMRLVGVNSPHTTAHYSNIRYGQKETPHNPSKIRHLLHWTFPAEEQEEQEQPEQPEQQVEDVVNVEQEEEKEPEQ